MPSGLTDRLLRETAGTLTWVDLQLAARPEVPRPEVPGTSRGATRWNCRDAGLLLPPGSHLRQDLRATASRRRVNGRVAGITPKLIRCRNLETGAMVEQRSPKLRFDCAALGLPASPGDRMLIQIRGRVD